MTMQRPDVHREPAVMALGSLTPDELLAVLPLHELTLVPQFPWSVPSKHPKPLPSNMIMSDMNGLDPIRQGDDDQGYVNDDAPLATAILSADDADADVDADGTTIDEIHTTATADATSSSEFATVPVTTAAAPTKPLYSQLLKPHAQPGTPSTSSRTGTVSQSFIPSVVAVYDHQEIPSSSVSARAPSNSASSLVSRNGSMAAVAGQRQPPSTGSFVDSTSYYPTIQESDVLSQYKSTVSLITSAPLLLRPRSVRPRGLLNSGNLCFMNAILQPLVHCAPFYNLFRLLASTSTHDFRGTTPIMDAMLMFMNEFDEGVGGESLQAVMGTTKASGVMSKDTKPPFAPEYVYNALRRHRKITTAWGRQEDAEEFLGFLLDGIHEEMVAMMEGGSGDAVVGGSQGSRRTGEVSDADTWLEVGRKHRTLVSRSMQVQMSPITRIFGGSMRSVVRRPGAKDSATIEPFLSVMLDVGPTNVQTIEDALESLSAVEVLEGCARPARGSGSSPTTKSSTSASTSTSTTTRGEVTRQTFIETLPPVLVLHMKRFSFDSTGGTLKSHKYVGFGTRLRVPAGVIAPGTREAQRHKEYRLFAVVYHHGKHAATGHYTCAIATHGNGGDSSGGWLSMDDDEMVAWSEAEVTRERRDRQAYMLFFCLDSQ